MSVPVKLNAPSSQDVWRNLFASSAGDKDAAIEVRGKWYFEREAVIKTIQGVVGELGGRMDSSGTPHAPYELVRDLELGRASGPDQLQAALVIRLLQPMEHPNDPTLRRLNFLRCVLDIHRDGQVSSHFKAMAISPKEVVQLLEKAVGALNEELEAARATRVHGDHP